MQCMQYLRVSQVRAVLFLVIFKKFVRDRRFYKCANYARALCIRGYFRICNFVETPRLKTKAYTARAWIEIPLCLRSSYFYKHQARAGSLWLCTFHKATCPSALICVLCHILEDDAQETVRRGDGATNVHHCTCRWYASQISLHIQMHNDN